MDIFFQSKCRLVFVAAVPFNLVTDLKGHCKVGSFLNSGQHILWLFPTHCVYVCVVRLCVCVCACAYSAQLVSLTSVYFMSSRITEAVMAAQLLHAFSGFELQASNLQH